MPESIDVYNDVDLGDWYRIVADFPQDPYNPCIYADIPIDPDPVPLSLNMQDSTGTVWSTDRLPTVLGWGDFDTRSLSLGGPGVGLDISGEIASIEVVPHAGPGPIPTVSTWGLVILALVLVIGGKVYFTHRRRAMQAQRQRRRSAAGDGLGSRRHLEQSSIPHPSLREG